VVHDRENHDVSVLNQIEHAVGESPQQRTTGPGVGIDHDIAGGLGLDAGEGEPQGDQEFLSRTDTAIAISLADGDDVRPGLGGEEDPSAHNPSSLRTSVSATAQGTLRSGAAR
jgi:hypothetical protein